MTFPHNKPLTFYAQDGAVVVSPAASHKETADTFAQICGVAAIMLARYIGVEGTKEYLQLVIAGLDSDTTPEPPHSTH
jgi:hypothetical protein